MLRVSILTDDRVRRRGLIAEHGLSLWIETGSRSILFDTGQTSVFMHNAKKMGIQAASADYVVISHGHYDHGGGLQYLPENKQVKSFYLHPEAFYKKFAGISQAEPYREVGIPAEFTRQRWVMERMMTTSKPQLIEKGIMISGEIPSSNDFEEAPKGFYVEKEGYIEPDIIQDEQMLIIEDEGELAIFLGCSHPGIINGIQYAQNLFPGKKIKFLIAGMHLDNVSAQRLQMTIRHLEQMSIRKVVPLHCTGFEAMCRIKDSLGDRCLLLCTGDQIEI